MSPDAGTASPVPDPSRWHALAILCLSLLILGIDNTVLNVAVPEIADRTGATTGQLQWMVDSYILVFACLLLPMGAVGDRYDRSKVLGIGLGVFCAASVGSIVGGANGIVAGRAVMGLGAALIMPATLALLTQVFSDPAERSKAIGIWAAVAGIAGVIGPLVGGFLVEHGGWQAAFLINVPITLAAIAGGRRWLPHGSAPGSQRRQFDPPGVVLSIAGFGALVWGVIHAPREGWRSPATVATLAVGVACMAAFVLVELRRPDPMFDPAVFRNRRFSVASAGITFSFFALFGSVFLFTQYLQDVLGHSPAAAGVRTLPLAVMLLVVAPLSPRLVARFGSRMVLSTGLILLTSGLVTASTVPVVDGYPRLAVAMTILATGTGLVTAPATESIMGALPPHRAGVGSAMNDATRQMGTALGVAVIGSIFATTFRSDLDAKLGSERADVVDAAGHSVRKAFDVTDALPAAIVTSVRRAVQEAFVSGFAIGVRIGALVTFLAAVAVVIWLPARPAQVLPATHPEMQKSG